METQTKDMSDTLNRIRLGNDDFVYEFEVNGIKVNKTDEIKATIIEEIQEELTFEEPLITTGPLTQEVFKKNNINGILDDLIAIGLNKGYAAIVPTRTNYLDVLLQTAEVFGKPLTLGKKLVEVTIMTKETISKEIVTIYKTYKWINEISGYAVTYTAYNNNNDKLNVKALLPSKNLDELNAEYFPNETRIPVALFKINKSGISPFELFSTTLSIINFYAAFELDDAELSKLKILVNGNVLKWSETEANKKMRKGGVMKMGSSKSYTYANPFTIVSAAADTKNIISARKEHQQALLDAIGVNPIIDTKKAQVSQGEQYKNERHFNRKTETRKRNLIKTLFDLILILQGFFKEEVVPEVSITTYSEYEYQKVLEEMRVKSNGKGKKGDV